MALQIWLPLNGTLDNFGVLDQFINTRDILYDTTNGKIGKQAMLFDGDATRYVSLPNAPKYQDNFTWAFWFKLTAFGTATYSFILSQGRDFNSYGFNVIVNNVNKTLCIMVGTKNTEDTSANSNTYVGEIKTIELNTWYHIAGVVKSGYVEAYVNGTLSKKQMITGNKSIDYSEAHGGLVLGKMSYIYTGTDRHFPFCGLLNDVRIYDHALSVKEIKDLSLGLCLYFPMNHFNINPNLAEKTNQGITNWSYSTLDGEKSLTEIDINGVRAARFECIVPSTGWVYFPYKLNLNLFKYNTTYTISFDLYANHGKTGNIAIREGNATNLISSYGMFSATKDTWVHHSLRINTYIEGTTVFKGQILYVSFSNNVAGDVFIIKNLKIDEGNETPWCPAVSDVAYSSYFDTLNEYDLSNSGNDAIIETSTSPSWSSPSPISNGCYLFSESQYLTINNSPFYNKSEFTISFWMNVLKLKTGAVICSRTAIGKGVTIFMLGNGTFRFDTGGEMWTTKTAVSMLNQWHHYTFKFTGKTKHYYLDGVLQESNTIGTIDLNTIDQNLTRVGASFYNGGPLDNFLTAQLSDLRVYATALSDSDIKSLYQTRFSIDKNGNINSASFNEITNSKVCYQKTGTLSTSSLTEFNTMDMEIKVTDDDKIWARIFYHDTKNGSLFISNDEALNTQTQYKYSRLNLIEYYRNIEGAFEFRLEYPREFPDTYNQWSQTDNPSTTAIEVVTGGTKVGGYTPIHIDWTTNSWGGLALHNATSCFIKGSIGVTNWYYAIGARTYWGATTEKPKTIPGPSSSTWVTEVELWVRIDNCPSLYESTSVKQFKTQIQAHQFNEL